MPETFVNRPEVPGVPEVNAMALQGGKPRAADGHGACFCRGTLILTERGEVPVEALAVGNRVVTLSGATKPIVWIGAGRDVVTRASRLARPVIVRTGALADAVPRRDLLLTYRHALWLEGNLIPVASLINHHSILWDEAARLVEFYHVELDDHDVLLAEGAPAESYFGAGDRPQFQTIWPGSREGTTAARFAPLLSGGDEVQRMWAELFERAGGRIESDTIADPDLHLVVDGRRLNPAAVQQHAYTFAFAARPAGPVSLRSRSAVPSLIGISRHDHRRLGVLIARIEVRQPGIDTIYDGEAPFFLEGGCYPPENGYVWTDGELTLPPRLFAHFSGDFTVTIHTERPGLRYPRPNAAVT